MRTTSTGVAAPSRWPSWRAPRTAISLTALTSLLLACAPATQPAATSAPAPTVGAPAKPAAPAAPAAAAQPAASPAAAANQGGGQPKGAATVVFEAEPNTIVPKDSGTNNGYFVLDNVYDHLTARDWSTGKAKIVPQLAESWSQVDEHTWRFKLRQNVKFTNGEAFDADAVVTAILDMADPQKPGIAINEYGSLQSAKKVDEFTADIVTKDPDPILTDRLVHFPIPAPNWLKNASPEELATHAVGSGPYLLTEYNKGQYLLFKANPNYWGPKPTIAEIKLIGRGEQTVRSAMVQASEADLAFNIAPETMNQMPKTVIEHTQELPMFRINWQHPVMKDIRVRQAIAEAIDIDGMIKALYPNGLAEPANGQLVRPGNVGYNPNLKPYPYKPDEAKKLMQETGAVGTPIEFTMRPAQFAHTAEVGELIVNQLNQIGFKTTVRNLESSQSTLALHAVKPGDATPDLQMTSVSSPVLDSTRPFDVYYRCGGISRIGCDPEWDRRYTEAKPLQGDARDKAFQALWAYGYDQYWYVGLFGLNWVHGSTAKFQWTPRLDDIVLFSEMSLNP